MTRNVIVAVLALSPAIAFAQATSPAQTAAPNAIQARLAPPPAIKPAVKDSSATIRISTGVVAPKLVKSVDLASTPGYHSRILANDAVAVVTLTVDAAGKPSDVAIAKSVDPVVDQEVVEAVKQFRFQPGTLDGQPFALPVRLEVTIQHGAQY
jgi:TonB family protein